LGKKNAESQMILTVSREKLTIFQQKGSENKELREKYTSELKANQKEIKELAPKLNETTESI
jgi:septal ring factor EnvC (AmiA/AmiB activator)